MKVILLSVFSFVLLSTIPAHASSESRNKEKKKSELEIYDKRRVRPKNSGPCRVIKNACIHAGFREDGPRGKDVKKDCEEILLMGSSVQGVHLIPGIIASCKQAALTEQQNELAK